MIVLRFSLFFFLCFVSTRINKFNPPSVATRNPWFLGSSEPTRRAPAWERMAGLVWVKPSQLEPQSWGPGRVSTVGIAVKLPRPGRRAACRDRRHLRRREGSHERNCVSVFLHPDVDVPVHEERAEFAFGALPAWYHWWNAVTLGSLSKSSGGGEKYEEKQEHTAACCSWGTEFALGVLPTRCFSWQAVCRAVPERCQEVVKVALKHEKVVKFVLVRVSTHLHGVRRLNASWRVLLNEIRWRGAHAPNCLVIECDGYFWALPARRHRQNAVTMKFIVDEVSKLSGDGQNCEENAVEPVIELGLRWFAMEDVDQDAVWRGSFDEVRQRRAHAANCSVMECDGYSERWRS